MCGMNLGEFLQHLEPVEFEITSSRFQSGSSAGCREIAICGVNPAHERQQSALGEVTLVDYLANSGAVQKDVICNADAGGGTHRMQSYLQERHWKEQQSLVGVYPPTQKAMLVSDTQIQSCKRAPVAEAGKKTVERKQKRMIKNRESAAWSRARKQAYTRELENKISLLEQENERLRKQKELDKALDNIPSPEPMFRFRRATSAPL